MSVLLIGTDRYPEDERTVSGKELSNSDLADFLVLLVFDHNRKTLTPIHICADTLCELPGDSAENNKNQKIALAYSFGKSIRNGCTNICKAAEQLLYGAPVDHYAAIDMEAIPLVNDLLGGITIILQDDFPALGSEFLRGNSVTLQGSEALAYIRHQGQESTDSHALRRDRQQRYLDAVIENISQAKGLSNLFDSSVRNTFFLHRDTQEFALDCLRKDRFHFIGSDCHNLGDRRPNIGKAAGVIREAGAAVYLANLSERQYRILGDRKT